MKKLTIVISVITVLLTGCLPGDQDKKETTSRNTKKQNTDIRIIKKPASKFKITNESMVGNWYVVASNPNPEYHNKILVGGAFISFYPNGVVEETKDLVTWVSVKKGKYTIDTSNNEVTLIYDGFHFKWKQLSPGKSKKFKKINPKLGSVKNFNTVYIKKGSADWNKYSKKRIDMQKIRDLVNSVDALELKEGHKYKIKKKTPLMNSNTYEGSMNPYYIKSGSIIEIITKKEVDGTIWYYTNIPSVEKKGWINSIALFGQEIQEVSK